MRNVIYGCDICQLVCPYNKGKDFHFHEEMEPKIEEVYPKLAPLLTISNKEFKQQFGHLAALGVVKTIATECFNCVSEFGRP